MNMFDLHNKNWLKNWSGNWSLLFASLYGDIYTKGLKKMVGENIENFIITFESGASSNYLVQEEVEKLCSTFIDYIKRDNSIAEKWAEHVIKESREILNFISNLNEKNITLEDYHRLCFLCSSMTPENFAVKKVVDYLPTDLLEKYLDIFSKARKATEPIYNEVDRILMCFLKQEVGDKMSEEEYSVLTKEELENYLTSKKLPDLNTLKRRYLGCAILYNKEGVGTILEGKNFTDLINSIIGVENKNEIKGMSAYKGIVKGRVRIISDPSKADNFEKGDVLVTGMTRPEYLHLMEKSSAFITDAGGLLSHAAIVARELKKPCIVGTNSATKVLKDGDIVEVNADTGIVRIIKRVS